MRELLLATVMVPISASAQAGQSRSLRGLIQRRSLFQWKPRRTPTALVSSRQKDIAEAVSSSAFQL